MIVMSDYRLSEMEMLTQYTNHNYYIIEKTENFKILFLYLSNLSWIILRNKIFFHILSC